LSLGTENRSLLPVKVAPSEEEVTRLKEGVTEAK